MKKKVLIFKNGGRAIVSGMGVLANGEEPIEEIDISEATDEEFKKLISNPKDQKLIDKLTKRNKKTKI